MGFGTSSPVCSHPYMPRRMYPNILLGMYLYFRLGMYLYFPNP